VRSRDQRGELADEVDRVELDGHRTILPDPLETVGRIWPGKFCRVAEDLCAGESGTEPGDEGCWNYHLEWCDAIPPGCDEEGCPCEV